MEGTTEFRIELQPSEAMATYYANHVAVTRTVNEVILTFSRVEIIPVSEEQPIVRAPIQAQVYLPLSVIAGLQDALDEQATRAPEAGRAEGE